MNLEPHPILATTRTLVSCRSLGGGGLTDQVLVMLRAQVADMIIGSVFLFVGLAACGIAAIRRRSGVRIFFWLGIWSAMYGALHLSQSPAVVAALPHRLQIHVPYANTAMTYLLVVVASLSIIWIGSSWAACGIARSRAAGAHFGGNLEAMYGARTGDAASWRCCRTGFRSALPTQTPQ